MACLPMDTNFRKYLLEVTGASDCEEVEIIQTLWSGYGTISRFKLMDSRLETVVVKCISPNQSSQHPRGWDTETSHKRKVKSYQIETAWYQQLSKQCGEDSRIAKFIGAFSEEQNQWIILEDLSSNFPNVKQQINFSEVKVCLKWLANFHATYLGKKPEGLWEIGTYWNLETRPDEFEIIEHEELKGKAHQIDDLLNACKFQTIVHGDAKLANFCFSEDGSAVAAVDFQYVGGGCGMKDVAYFLGSSLSSSECELYEKDLLDFYFTELQKSIEQSNIEFKDLKSEWSLMYPIACADFTRFLLGWMPSHQKVNDYNRRIVKAVLADL